MQPRTHPPHFPGLRTVLFHAPDLAQAKSSYASVLGFPPCFDQSFHVGFIENPHFQLPPP
jgi:hypothetical protein